MTTHNRKLTEPLETTAAVFGSLFAAVLILAGVATLVGTGTLGGLGHVQVCATDPFLAVMPQQGTDLTVNRRKVRPQRLAFPNAAFK